MLERYYELTKPGIVYANALIALATFLYASGWHFALQSLAGMLIGLALVVASACVFNNAYDRGIDRLMARTKDRALAAGTIPVARALAFGTVLGVAGFATLFLLANALSCAAALFGFAVYVLAYTPAKHRTHWSTLVGSLAGAAPVAVGYAAATGRLDLTAGLIFLALALWQMPHFYAIALYRLEDYRKAGVPTLPLARTPRAAKRAILAYMLGFVLAECALFAIGAAGYAYLAIALASFAFWARAALQGFADPDDAWGRRVFLASLIALCGFALALAVSPLLAR
ncbi:MAG TPA: heme o synthase [Candidatus Paceibacterota bacterium]|nr:heme o synthase [Candidatus Paceibacterota bacterium]